MLIIEKNDNNFKEKEKLYLYANINFDAAIKIQYNLNTIFYCVSLFIQLAMLFSKPITSNVTSHPKIIMKE